jgi:hypothetical protein
LKRKKTPAANKVLPKAGLKSKVQHLCFLSAKTIIYLLEKCKLENKKMVLLTVVLIAAFVLLILPSAILKHWLQP